ncbi:MAG: PAS domain S-box protein [Devosia nanyangense]|uniref:histidine kinase n=1 Tax=Devosia nanyangense TaxID=1228055 RepID=A0A933NYL9_9HYPH|nr:PAS domain S-box protein [Devosia nanyangense]
MRARDPTKLKALELKYRGLAMEDGLWEAARALAAQVGAPAKPARLRKSSTQYPFETALTQQLRAMEARYGALIDGAPDAMVVTNAAGEIILVNSKAGKQFGYEREGLLGLEITVIATGGFPEQLLAAGVEAAMAAAGEQAVAGIELGGIRKDNSRFPLEAMLSLVDSAEGPMVMLALRDISARRVTERHLVEAEARLRSYLEAAPDAIVAVNKRGRISLVNAQTEEMFGYHRDDLLGQPVTAILPEELAQRLLAERLEPAAAAATSDPAKAFEHTGRRKDGSDFLIETKFGLLRDAQGTVAIVTIRDLGQQSMAVRRATEVEDFHHRLLDAAPDAVVVVDQAGEIVLANAQAESRFGFSRDELTGRPVTRILPEGFAEWLVAGALRSAEVALAQEIGTGIELVGRRKDGTRFPVEIMLSPTETPRGTLMIATLRDISMRKAAERHPVAGTDDSFRVLFESSHDPVVVGDAAGRIVLMNRAAEQLFGYDHAQVLGQSIANLLPARFREAGTEDARGAEGVLGHLPRDRDLEVVGLRKDQTEFPIALNLRPVETPDGTLLYCAIRDVTVRQAAERAARQRETLERRAAELARSNEDLQQFAYVAAHDLQEPLRMVASYTTLLADRYQGRLDADADAFIGYTLDGVQRMQVLIGDLLSYCRVGSAALRLERLSSSEVLDQALLTLGEAIAQSGATVSHGELPDLAADRSQLIQLFHNLIGNAIKYRGDEPPIIRISATRSIAGEWVFAVADNGIGIEPQNFERIFAMFQRLHTSEDRPGTGIGLAICKRIAERHGGRIWVESAAGSGSTFYVALPDTGAS